MLIGIEVIHFLIFFIGIPFAFILTIIVWFVDHVWLTPQESKIIKKATRKKKPVVPVASDVGQIELKIVEEIGDEGYIRTKDDWVGFLPRPITSNPDKNAAKVNPILSKVLSLKNAKIPFLMGYSGKAILTNPEALALLEYGEKKKLKLPFKLGDKNVEVNIFWPVDPRTIKSLFPKSWNQAQIRALEKKKELVGILKGKKFFGAEGMKYFVLPLAMITLVIVVFALTIIFLK